MSSKKSNILRFAFGSPKNIKSWIWRIWINKDDVYLGTRDAVQAFKVSLHASNIWRVAYVKELRRDSPETDRVIIKWQRPEEFALGWTASIGILISSIDAKRPFEKNKIEDTRIQWISPPAKGKKLIIKILFSKPGTSKIDFKRVSNSSDMIVGKFIKKSGEVVWLVLREDDMTQVEIAKIQDVMQKTKIHLKSGFSENFLYNSRALLVVSDDIPQILNQPTIIDIALGKENIEIPTNI